MKGKRNVWQNYILQNEKIGFNISISTQTDHTNQTRRTKYSDFYLYFGFLLCRWVSFSFFFIIFSSFDSVYKRLMLRCVTLSVIFVIRYYVCVFLCAPLDIFNTIQLVWSFANNNRPTMDGNANGETKEQHPIQSNPKQKKRRKNSLIYFVESSEKNPILFVFA